MSEDKLLFRHFLQDHINLPENEWAEFLSIWKPYHAARKQYLSKPDEKEKYLYFILEGVQRVFYTDFDEKEATLIFTYPHSFGGVADSFLLQQPSKYYYETLTSSRFLRTSHSELEFLRSKIPTVNSFFQEATHHAFSGLLERMVELQCFSSTEKFKKLLERSPHILQIVPQKYLANYIGIDPTNFSKLLHSIKL